jgi:acyl-CoA dehydrogenase
VRAAIEKICARFGDDYWLERDRDGKFPDAFHGALAGDGWLGICIPEAYGGSGLGITEAAVMMQTIAASGSIRSWSTAATSRNGACCRRSSPARRRRALR